LKFRCPNCSHKLRAKDSQAGWICTCPRCRRKIRVPEASDSESPTVSENNGSVSAGPPKPLDNRALHLAPTPKQADSDADARAREQQFVASLGPTPSPDEYTGERRLAWPIDILLYPASFQGLIAMAIIIGVPLLMGLIGQFVPFLGFAFWLPMLLVNILIGVYAVWYLAECVHDSARGGTRAPEVSMAGAGLGDMWSRVMYLVAVYVLFALPPVLYYMWTQQIDLPFWGLVAWAIIFYPIGLLAMVVNDSTSALNPLFLLGSIFRTFFPYAGLLLLLTLLATLVWLVPQIILRQTVFMQIDLIAVIVGLYGTLIIAHILGRFYWRYRERLDWGL